MSRSSLGRKLLLVGALGVAALVYSLNGSAARTASATEAVAQAQPFDPATYVPATLAQEQKTWKDAKLTYEPAMACQRCHTQPLVTDFVKNPGFDSKSTDFVLLTEYSIWKVHDKHAQAYAVLEGPRGRQMAKLLGFDSATDAKAGCLACHGMYNLPGTEPGFKLEVQDGVNCGGCHGPSSKWRGDHTGPKWRNLSPKEKMEAGLRDLRDGEVRARLCVSCHVGSASEGKVVTHAMFAAGHPPLPPIEIATFSRNEPQHWLDAADVPYFKTLQAMSANDKLAKFHGENPKYQLTHLALVGNVVSLRETMQLVHDRASFSSTKLDAATAWPETLMRKGTAGADAAKARWPEIAMAHSDCYACHHDLRYPAYRQVRGYGFQLPGVEPIRAIPGRPMIRTWPLGLIQPTLELTADEQKRIGDLRTKLVPVVKALNLRPFGRADQMASASTGVLPWCEDTLKALRGMKIDDKSALKLMHALCAIGQAQSAKGTPYLPDYESGRQIASLLRIVFEEWQASTKSSANEAKALIDALAKSVDTEPYLERIRRLKAILAIVKPPGMNDEVRNKAIEDFSKYVTDIGNLDNLDPQTNDVDKRAFQALVSEIGRLTNDRFNKHINSKAMIDLLQELGDKEQKQLLKTLSDYQPNDFRDQLRKIGAKLPK